MTTQINRLQTLTMMANRISNNALWPIRFARRWFTPRSDNAEMQFREKTIRLFLGFMIPLSLFIFVANFLWYGLDTITLEKLIKYPVLDVLNIVGWPVLTTLMVMFYFYSAWAVSKNRLKQAGDILVAAFMLFSTGVLVIETYYSPLTLPAFMVAILVCSVMISRKAIWTVTVLLLAAITAIVVVQHAAGFYPDTDLPRDPNGEGFAPVSWQGILLNIYTPLIAEAVILYVFRIEMDTRLQWALAERDKAEAASRAKSQFLANMSHELILPLHVIRSSSDLILLTGTDRLTSTDIESLHVIRRSEERLLELVTNTLELSKLDIQGAEVYLTEVNLSELVRETMEGIEGLARDKCLELKISVSPSLTQMMLVDVDKIKIIITNLVGNALKFTEHGKVEIRVSQTEKALQFEVEDTGIGMAVEFLDKIFDDFYQIDSLDNRSYQGAGLGLAVVKRLVSVLKGQLQVKSALGKGSTFTVTLPTQLPVNID